MGVIGKDFKYKIVKNFLSKDEIRLLSIYCEIKHRLNSTHFDFIQESPNADSCFYADPIMETLLLSKQKLMEKETGKKLLPTYSYWRCYSKYATLSKHKDRPSCEISTTVFIGGDTDQWPIYMDGEAIHLKRGDAAIYLGCELLHHRDEFQGDHQFQTFLHYVDAYGNKKEWHLDKRPYWGFPKVEPWYNDD
jgi:hypothetical protein|tara:strand:+ start:2745 stop:3320 length:576 start_codon:yes stop_codon:yes gene_type:complete